MWDEYVWLKDAIDKKEYDEVRTAVFQRLSNFPTWGWENWLHIAEKSGSMALDLHIHDIDMARYIWGNPKEVSCCTADVYSKKDIAHSRLMYDDFSVMAIGDWTRKGLPFSKSYSVAFEKATVVYNGGDVNVYPRDGEEFSPELDSIAAHKAEIEYFVECIEKDNDITGNIPEDSALSVKLISALIESSDKNGEFVDFITE
jgi:predicted dehydrogenase